MTKKEREEKLITIAAIAILVVAVIVANLIAMNI